VTTHPTPRVVVQELKLCCIIKGYNATFTIEISGNNHVSDLKERIWAKCNRTIQNNTAAMDLKLSKVRNGVGSDIDVD
jgi:hypothetical protein